MSSRIYDISQSRDQMLPQEKEKKNVISRWCGLSSKRKVVVSIVQESCHWSYDISHSRDYADAMG